MRNLLKKINVIVDFVRAIRFIAFYISPKHPKLLKGEVDLFIKIAPRIKTLIDVGARYDVDYIELSKNNDISYHLFEINPRYFSILLKRLKSYKSENIVANNVGIGLNNSTETYNLNSESVIDRFPNRILYLFSKKLRIITLESYFESHHLDTVDFLKTDIELYDYFALKGLGQRLQNVKFVQFELGLGAPYSGRFITNIDYFLLFTNKQKFFFIMDENNPMFTDIPKNTYLISFEMVNLHHIEKVQATGIGFNVLAVRNDIEVSSLGLNVFRYDERLFSQSLEISETALNQ